ncbi:hypothetical protein Gorai_023553, partial [Gossypium raimondii]|nr:hypothetical protein [Gossypium raimondii]
RLKTPFSGIAISTLGVAISTFQGRPQGSILPEVSRYPLLGKWVHLFTDGAVDRGFGSASASGVLRDKNGNWILGKCFKRVMIQTDNPEMVKALQDIMMVDSGI